MIQGLHFLQKAAMAVICREDEASQLLQAQAHVWNHFFNFINSMSLKCAVQLSIPDIINNNGGKPMTLSKLILALPIHPTKIHHVSRLMRVLVRSGFFSMEKLQEDEEEEEGYVLTASSRLLLKDNPLSVTPFLLSVLDPVLTEPWNYLSAWFQNDVSTPFNTAHGLAFWEYCAKDQEVGRLFDEAMASDARLVTSVVVGECKGVFDGLETLVDVGGGTGTLAKALTDAFPGIECTVLDLPHVVSGLKGSEKLKYIGGDMFVEVPPADAVLLKWILHDWSDEECMKILKKSNEAVTSKGKKGKVIIIDMVVEEKTRDKEAIETQLFFDMLMMVIVTGKERDEKQWAKLFFDAGFSDYKIFSVLGLRSLIEIYP